VHIIYLFLIIVLLLLGVCICGNLEYMFYCIPYQEV